MLNLLSAVTAGNAFFLAFLVFSVRHDTNVLANRWLGVFLLILGVFLAEQSFYVFHIFNSFPFLIGWFSLPTFALAPCLYMAVSYYVTLDKRFKKKDLWHFLPFFLFTLLSIPTLIPGYFPDNTKELEATPENATTYMLIFLLLVQISAYWWFSYRSLSRHRKNIENISASPETVNLDWLRYSLLGILLMTVAWIGEIIFTPWYLADATWATPLYCFGIYFLGYYALRQREVFPYTQEAVEEMAEIMEEQTHSATLPKRQFFTSVQIDQLKQALQLLMQVEKPYLNNELSLPELARQANLSTHEMSHLINEGYGENFYQFVNRFRVEASKSLLLSEQHAHLSMVGIAYESGFNSKTAFNTAFKKIAGISPSEFQKNKAEVASVTQD